MTADSNPQDLDARVDGLRIVLAMVLNMMPDHGIVRDRLRLLEETARRQNMESGTIAELREFRERFE
jgi:hypothetical protein